jgi:hypothetical protein
MGFHPPGSKTDSLLPLSRRADCFWYFQRAPAQLSNTIIRLSQARGVKIFDTHGVAGHGFDSAEKPSVHPSSASGRTEEQLKSLEIFRSC